MIDKRPLKMTPLFDELTIAKRVAVLGEQITRDFHGEPVVVVGVLKGAFVFLADLVRQIKLPIQIEFVGVSSYEGTTSGHVRITRDLSADIQGKNLLLVEDIIDTGKTIDHLLAILKTRGPKTVRVCALLSKPEAHDMTTQIDYTGFEITKEFVVGYGLDLDGCYRELPYIAQVKE